MDISLATSFLQIAPAAWDACAGSRNPFVSHRFFAALERSGSVGEGTGWLPRPLLVQERGRLIAAAPLWLKLHSQGEYIFDHAWADAFERAGGRYYPKLQVAVPFTPATGPRLLCAQGYEATGRAALFEALAGIAAQNQLSSVHITHCPEAEVLAAPAGWHPRVTEQFHWENDGYASYEAFLERLTSRKRKALRKERALAQSFGGQIRALSGDEITPAHWDAFWAFYQDTGARKWGRPYLTRAFFDELHAHMREDLLLVLAEREGAPIAGALNFIGADTLFGRWWGCLEDHPFLHFELCYHQAIDFAIVRGLKRVEAGAQGAHKLARGYLPRAIHSLHHLPDLGFSRAVGDYLREERAAMAEELSALSGFAPFKEAGS